MFCTVKNQIRKLFKTWVAIFLLVCMLIGGVIGRVVAIADDSILLETGKDFGELVIYIRVEE